MPVASGPGGVLYNTPTGGGLLSGLDPDYQSQEQQLRASQAFQNGVPTDAQGNPDYEAMASRMVQLGAFDQGDKLLTTGINMQGLRAAQQAANDPLLTGGTPATGGPGSGGGTSAPSGSRGGSASSNLPGDYLSRLAQVESGGNDNVITQGV